MHSAKNFSSTQGIPNRYWWGTMAMKGVINNEYCHWNATTIPQKLKPFYRTAKSGLSEGVERKNDPSKVYGDLIDAAGGIMKRQSSSCIPRIWSKLSQCGMYNQAC
jgi:hypothetical protein